MSADDRDDRPAWLEDELEPGTSCSPRRRLLLALATLPWLAVAGWLVLGDRGEQPAQTSATTPALDQTAPPGADDQTAPPGADDQTAPPGADDQTAPPREPAPPAETFDDVPVGPSVGDVTTVAFAVARATLAGPGSALEVDGLHLVDDRYLEHAIVHGVELVADDVAVVTLGTVLLPIEDGAYGPAEHRLLAVPVAVGERAAPAGTPWWLPSPPLELAEPILDEVDDPDLAVAAADVLTAAGYEDVAIAGLGRSPTGALAADVTATTSTGEALDGLVWLHEADGRLWPAGSTPVDHGPTTEPADQTSGSS